MPLTSMSQTLQGKQIQSQKLSANQIMSIQMISMTNQDLRDRILSEVEKNPALEIVSDPMIANGSININVKNTTNYYSHSGNGSSESSDAYNKMIENQEDERETLQQHLLEQLNMTSRNKNGIKLSEKETEVCRLLIENLDSRGFHILAPDSLKNHKKERIPLPLLNTCMNIVRHFDPAGICVKDTNESLLVQTELIMEEKNISVEQNRLVLFILHHGYQNFLSPEPAEIRKKILNWLKENDSGLKNQEQKENIPEFEKFLKQDVTDDAARKALYFIRELNLHPDAGFSASSTIQRIFPDVEIVFEPGKLEKDDYKHGKVTFSETEYLHVIPLKNILPEVRMSTDLEDILKYNKSNGKKLSSELKKNIEAGKSFINMLKFRENSVYDCLVKICAIQKDFFKYGQGNLVPLSQKKLAQILDISESTVSRMADSKYIVCSWGTYPMKRLFSHSINRDSHISDEKIKTEISKIINSADGKKLSDQKIADLLADRGIKIARRTVQKYRSQLNISSSFKR